MSETKRVLIAGCGYVGTALGLRLSAVGHRVWGLRRHPGELPSPIEPLAADLADPSSLAVLPRDLDWVVYAAAAGGFSDERYRAAYVDGPRHLLSALAATGIAPRRLVFTSSTGVYAQSGGEQVDETSPTEPTHFSGTRLLQ
jgi:nucleoside-diphosphate-sugar epimerase